MNAPKQILRALLFICIPAIATMAQDVAPSADSPRDANSGVYVRDSAVASEKLALADHLEHLQEWAKAADVYQELLQKFADRVAPSGKNQDDRIDRYTSVANIVQDKLSAWPADGLAMYRGRYEIEAANLLQQAGNDPAALHNIVSLYFLTSSGKAAAMRLIDIEMENGDFAAASWMGNRLLKSYPDLDADRPMLLYRTAVAYRLAGDATDAQAKADELSKNFSTAQGTIQGKQIALADSLQKLLKSPPQPGENVAPDSWPMAFGSLDRARVPGVGGFGGAKIFNVELSKQDVKEIAGNVANAPPQRQLAERQIAADRDLGLMTGVMPVVDRGELFFQDNVRVYALNLDSGLPLAGWAQTYDGDQHGQFRITAWPTPRNMLQTIALTDDSVLALMGQVDMNSMMMNFSERDTQLICLDRSSGKQKWIFRPSQLPGETLQGLELSGTPLVVGENIYVTAHSTAGVQFQDCYLLCVDLSGHFKWSTYIASANAGAAIFNGDYSDLNSAIPQLAYSGGRVFVLTNLGALASVDAYDGTIAWLDLYPRDSNTDPLSQFRFRGWNRPQNETGTQRPWTTSPAIVSNGKIFVLPTDGRYLMIYDAATGAEIQHIKGSHIEDATTLLAVLGDRLVLCGPGVNGQDEQTHVLCIDWTKYQADDLTGKEIVWRDPLSVGLRGRGFVTADAVYIPTQKKLFRINLKNGKADAEYPEGDRTWDTNESSGNILVTQDHLVIAGPQWVNVYTDLNLAMAKLDKEVAATPDDPNARLKYAEIMFVAGKTDVAVAKLDEAIQVIGGLQNSSASPARDRIFTDAMAFPEKLRKQFEDNSGAAAGKEDIATINGLYDRAASAASNPQQQVNYRLSRADFANHQHDAVTELKLLQEILAEPNWRSVAVVRENAGSPMQAANVAEAQIDELKKNSPDVYAPVQAEAAKAFADAQTTADPAKLLSVAQMYPNSDVAPQAMLKAADAYESVGNSRQAVQILRQHYLKYPNAADGTVVLESLARNYLATPNHVDVALARLMQAARRSSGAKLTRPLLLPDGTVLKDVSFEQAADSLRRYIEQDTDRALPDFGIPPPGDYATAKPFIRQPDPVALKVESIVSPVKDFSRTDRIVVWSSDAAISVFAPGKNDPVFTSHVFKDAPMSCAWMGENLLIVSPSKIALLKPDGSAALWESELKSIPLLEVATRQDNPDDNADQQQFVNGPARINVNGGQVMILQNGRRIFIPGNGRFRMRFGGGIVAAANQQPAVAVGAEQFVKLTMLADRAILATSDGRIICTDLSDGKTLWQVRPSDRPAKTLLATDDFVVAEVVEGDDYRVLAFDAFSGQSITHREFSNNNGGLTNLALSTDGKLIYVLPDHLDCYDLFEPADHAAYSVPVKANDGNGAFSGALAPDQVLITEGRVVVVSDSGRFLRIYPLDKPAQNDSGEAVDATHGLQTRSKDWQVSLAAAGSRLYALGERTIIGYNINDLKDNWSDPDYTDMTRFDYAIGKDYLLVIGQLIADPNRRPVHAQPKAFRIRAYSRMVLPNGHESGVAAYDFPLNTPSGISACQGADGGLFYLTGDHKLYFLKGARK